MFQKVGSGGSPAQKVPDPTGFVFTIDFMVHPYIYWLGEGRLKLCLYLSHYSQSVSDVTKQDADPRNFNANPDPSFHFNADPDPTFRLTADPYPAPPQSDVNLGPLVYRPSGALF